ncbi:hypothetical protein QBC34DRAFT_375054 [Podospora aff. communis PSN243]|uniref:Secreted protein n=1 Tax=Podospora aff. communis PSN243 TaxID=3040156 RepID=A0AAV9H3H4_9PEZI|nr:hypothetical protein QBC34DRAFT_375054 [Podospora aff. communis PSN243]
MGPLAKLTVLLAALAPSLVQSATPDRLPQIKSITFSGSGCPSDPKWSGGFNDLQISFGEFGARIPGDRGTVNCQVHIQGTGGSPGWQVALKETWVTGHVWLQPGTKLEYLTTSFFSQDATKTNTQRGEKKNDGKGSINEDVVLYTDLSRGQVWSQCFGGDGYTGIFNVNFRGVLSGDGGRASFEAQKQQWRLDWRRC